MNRSDLERLRDPRDFARHVQDSAGGVSAETQAAAKQAQHAVLYGLLIIGETLGKISAEVKGAAPDIPWRAIANLRNVLVHAYWLVDLELIIGIVQHRIDPLIAELNRLIRLVEGTGS
jgi:uncharacterized protein with HEPN domain